MAMESMSEALQRLTVAGYVDEYMADSAGLRSRLTGSIHPPESFRVDEIVRFEGDSDPSDESAVLALTHTTDGAKGTYVVAFGTLMDAADAALFSRISTARR